MTSREAKHHILLAEDTAVGRKVISQMLVEAGFQVSSVGDGRAVIDSLAGMPFSLIVMDCMMPGLDGWDATRAIRRGDAGEDNAAIPIIALTGLNSAEDERKCRDAGMDVFVRKPVDYDSLLEAVQQLLDAPAEVADDEQPTPRQEQDLLKSLDEWSPGFMDTIIDQFLEEVPGEVSALREAMAAEDLPRLGKLAHRLRGSADVLSVRALSGCARALEKAAMEGNLALVRQLAPALVLELERLDEGLRPA